MIQARPRERSNLLAFPLPGETGSRTVVFPKRKMIFVQGAPSDSVFYVATGTVRLTVVAETGKEVTLGILNRGDFFGEGCLAGQCFRMCSAIAMTDCSVVRIEKKVMLAALHREQSFSDLFIASVVRRNLRYEQDLVDQLFNMSEKRLARKLVLLTNIGRNGRSKAVIPKISQETLAEMVGTTRARVSSFMNKFRKLGFIDYDEWELEVRSSLLCVVAKDSFQDAA